MPKELKLNGGQNDLRVKETEGYLALTIENRKSFKGDTTGSGMLAMLTRDEEVKLLRYLQQRAALSRS